MKKWIVILAQVVFFCAFSILMDKFVDILHINIPGSIVGIFVLFILLQLKVIPLKWVDLGASWLVAELLLFFVPSAVGIMKYQTMLAQYGVKIAFVILIGTIVVMACSGLLAKKISNRKGH
ncbi:MAG: CidA/LrgA family holin-like protein [Tuberibacillus sp.]